MQLVVEVVAAVWETLDMIMRVEILIKIINYNYLCIILNHKWFDNIGVVVVAADFVTIVLAKWLC